MKFIQAHPFRWGIGALLLLLGILYLSDPLNRFAIEMFYKGITLANWQEGFCGMIDLPVTARPEDIATEDYRDPRYPCQILETKKIWIPNQGNVWAVRRKDGDHNGRIVTLLLYFSPGPCILHPHSEGCWIVKSYYE